MRDLDLRSSIYDLRSRSKIWIPDPESKIQDPKSGSEIRIQDRAEKQERKHNAHTERKPCPETRTLQGKMDKEGRMARPMRTMRREEKEKAITSPTNIMSRSGSRILDPGPWKSNAEHGLSKMDKRTKKSK